MKVGELVFVVVAVAACGRNDNAPAGAAKTAAGSAQPAAPKLRLVGCSAANASSGFQRPAPWDLGANTHDAAFAWPDPIGGGGGIYGDLLGSASDGPGGFGTAGTIGAGGGPMHGHRAAMPAIALGPPGATGDLDKVIIRRFMRQNLQRIRFCYEKQLLAKPGLDGTVMTHFFIAPSGAVKSVTADGMDPAVASCVANVIRRITFPKPTGGGGVQVNYPFAFRTPDDSAAAGTAGSAGGSATPPAPKPTPGPWTPFATQFPLADPDIVAATSKELEPRLASIEACLPVGRTGALRTMLRIYSDGIVTTRVGGIGDDAIESCVTRALAGLTVVAAPHPPVDVACDVIRGDDPSWRVTPGEPYTGIEITKTALRMGSDHWPFSDLLATGAAPALGPDFSPSDEDNVDLAIVDPDAPLANLGYVIDRIARTHGHVLVAVREATGAPRFAFAADYRDVVSSTHHDDDLALRLAGHHLDVCSPAIAVPTAAASDPAAVDAALAAGAATCENQKCAAADVLAAPDTSTAELLALAARIRRTGIEVIRFVPQGASCARPGARAGSGGGSASAP